MASSTADPDTSAQAQNTSVAAPELASEPPAAAPIAAATDTDTTSETDDSALGESDTLDLQYHALRLAFGDKAYFAPIGDEPKAIMDVGTGTGTMLSPQTCSELIALFNYRDMGN
ncbi:MAG: hypothetical protein OHK93_007145 [Ramalina farinacea]|uniref:Uncharacterized protein n=1 Tax=Ramalina farinacea TaxID=258253 RepID=A0AA43QJX5_9LECA|nr:hypothetical protein [Ramalina farinacea]